MAAFATHQQLAARRRPLLPSEVDTAVQLLDDAAVMIRAKFPTIDARIAAGTTDAAVPVIVSCSMVRRAMFGEDTSPGVKSMLEVAGPFTQQTNFANPSGDLYFTKAEKELLADPGSKWKAFSVDLAPEGAGDAYPASDGGWL